MNHLRTIAVAGFLAATVLPAAAIDISGAGATFPYPIYAKWADAYKKETGVGLNYQSIGSGGGIKQIEAKTVTFGATDAPLKGADLEKNGLVQFPDGDGRHRAGRERRRDQTGRACSRRPDAWRNLPRHGEDLGRSGDQEAQSERQAAGAGDRRRPPLRRFRHHLQLHLLSGGGQPRVEIGGRCRTSVEWPVGIGAKGNEGVSNNVAQTKGSIGYVEYAYALQNKLTYTKMVNKDGKTVAPTSEAFQAAAANADWNSVPGYGVILANQPRRGVVADDGGDLHPDPEAAAAIPRPRPRRSSSSPGPMPRATRWPRSSITCRCPRRSSVKIEKMWGSEIKDSGGKPLRTSSMAH